MAPLRPQRGDGKWLQCFPNLGDGQMGIGWYRVSMGSPPYVFLVAVYGKAHRMLGGPLPKKGVALRASPGLAAMRLAAMLICWREI